MRFIFLLLFSLNAYAAPYCQDYLGGAKFQQPILANHDYSQGAGMFATTFGDSLPLATALANRGVPFLRIQLAWEDDHNFKEAQFGEIAKQAKRFCPLAQKTKLYLSGACEHNLNSTLAQRLASLIAAACPPAIYVNTPWRGAVLPQYVNETHGEGNPKSSRSSFSSDGTASEDSDIQNLKNKPYSEFFCFWSPRYNGRWESNDSTPRPQRKGYADAKMIKSMLALAKPKGATSLPQDCHINKKTKKQECRPTKWIYKSHSENKNNGDVRAEKPVFIAPVKTNSIKLGSADCKYYGPFDNGRWRYYCPKWGYEIGTSPIQFKYGTINPAFRDGVYR